MNPRRICLTGVDGRRGQQVDIIKRELAVQMARLGLRSSRSRTGASPGFGC